jgi:hypothetical protein
VIVIIFAIAMISSVSKKTPKAGDDKKETSTSQEQKKEEDKNKTDNKTDNKTNGKQGGSENSGNTSGNNSGKNSGNSSNSGSNSSNNSGSDKKNDNGVAVTKPANEANNMPSTGPVSNVVTTFLIAASAYLIALNAGFIKH